MWLEGIRILDLTRLLPGPYGSQLLADLGAEVIKVEDPKVGDYARRTPPLSEDGNGAVFRAVNRGKKSICLDLKSDRGQEAFHKLAGQADVVFEQFRPGVVSDLAVDYETVVETNPDIVYCSLSGYGQTGPYRDRVGHDLNYIGVSGLLDMTRSGEDEPPCIPGFPIADMAGGLFAAFSITGALLARELGNAGSRYIDVSMVEAVASFSQAVTSEASVDENPTPGATRLTGGYPCYDVYEAADGQYVTLAALEPKFWAAFCQAVGLEELIDNHLSDDPVTRREVRDQVADKFQERTAAAWIADLGENAMVGPVNTPEEALADRHLGSRGMIRCMDGGPVIGSPILDSSNGHRDVSTRNSKAPERGEHTATILADVGYSEEDIAELRQEDVI